MRQRKGWEWNSEKNRKREGRGDIREQGRRKVGKWEENEEEGDEDV